MDILFEPKPTEGRLLSIETVLRVLSPKEKVIFGSLPKRERKVVADIIAKTSKAQRDLTASILDAKYAQEKVDFAGSIYDEAICMAEVECRAKLKGIKRKIESDWADVMAFRFDDEWEAIWKGVGV